MGKEVRNYDTEDQARQAWDDLEENGASCTYSESGGDSDGTGGTYELKFDRDTYEETKQINKEYG